MHIAEGFLPAGQAIGWTVVSVPFVGLGLRSIKRKIAEHPERRMLLGVAAAFTFVLSSLKLPSITGSCSHPTGTGLGAVMFGPLAMAPIGVVVLFFQAILLAHGGITTLGANTFSMAIVGPFVAVGVWRLSGAMKLPMSYGVFFAAMLGDLATYVTTSFQLALAFPDPASGVLGSASKFLLVFAVTQIPLAVTEGLLTVVVLNALTRFDPAILADVGLARLAGRAES